MSTLKCWSVLCYGAIVQEESSLPWSTIGNVGDWWSLTMNGPSITDYIPYGTEPTNSLELAFHTANVAWWDANPMPIKCVYAHSGNTIITVPNSIIRANANFIPQKVPHNHLTLNPELIALAKQFCFTHSIQLVDDFDWHIAVTSY